MTAPTSQTAARQPSLADLTARFLARRSPVADGCDAAVEPYEVASGFRTDPRVAWGEGVAVLKLLGAHPSSGTAPSEWATVVRSLPPATALPLCLGHFPQQVSDLSGLLSGATLVPPVATKTSGVERLIDEADRRPTGVAPLLAAAFARLTGDYALAAELLAKASGPELGTLRANEEAALLWQQGRYADAIAVWERMPASAVKAFNLGMAYLFIGRPEAARDSLTKAAAELPESTAWAHLAQLYLVLAAK